MGTQKQQCSDWTPVPTGELFCHEFVLFSVFRLLEVGAACHVSRAAMRAAVESPKFLIARPAEAGAVTRSISALSRGPDAHHSHLMALVLVKWPFMHVMHLLLSLQPKCQ